MIEILSRRMSKREIMQIVSEITMQSSDFYELFDSIFRNENKKDERIAWHAAWVIDHISRQNSACFSNEMKVKLSDFSPTVGKDGHLRLCLSILLNIGLPDEVSGDFINFCFQNILNEKTAVAVRALSIKLLSKICKTEPDLINELTAVLQNINYQNSTAGMKAVVQNFFKNKL
ncbi:MAG: hypothetical protein LBB41_08165 [Prevotellaceae bacterium]|jgi:hypothetical protein|nr:hypothetical protein [Prevotellaceae bacterium]